MLQRALVAKSTFSVTFGAPFFGPQICSFCNCSEYVTFPTMPATIVRELTACVTFGAPGVGVPMSSCRRPISGHPLDMACGDAFWAHAIMNSSQSKCLRHMLPSRGAARLGLQLVFSKLHRFRCWHFLAPPCRVLIFARLLLDTFASVNFPRACQGTRRLASSAIHFTYHPFGSTLHQCSRPCHLVY